GRVEPHRRAILRGDARAADAIEGGGRIGHLDEARKADAAINAPLAQLRLLGTQRLVAHHLDELVERGVVRELFELDAGWPGARIAVVRNEIAPPDLDRVHADARRRHL